MEFVKFLNVILLLFLFINMYMCVENQLNSYLKDRYQDVKVKLTDSFKQNYRNNKENTQIIVHTAHTFSLPYIPVCFNMKNETYILMYDQIFTISLIHNAYLFEPHSTLPNINQKITNFKVIEYQDIILASVVFSNGYCNIYTYKDNFWNFVQQLPKAGLVTDVCLFTQDDNLYLFIINNLKMLPVPSILYKWTGTQFAESDSILTMEATSASCFKNKNYQIIVITQNPINNNNMIGTYVLEAKKGKIRKNHFLNSYGADKVISYVLNKERYIIVLNNKVDSTIYWWDENYFIKWKHFKSPISYKKLSVYYIRNNPVLFAATEDQLVIYNLENENIISKIPYHNYYWKILDLDYALLNDQIIFYVTGLNEENNPEMLFVSVSFETNLIQADPISNDDMIIKCLVNLNEKLKFRSDLINNMKLRSQKILQKNKDEVFKGIITSYEDVNVKNNVVHNKYTYAEYEQYLPVKEKLKVLKEEVDNAYNKIKHLKGNVTITGKLHVENLKVPSLHVSKINNQEWNPNKWFLKSKPQVIHSAVTARNVVAKQIVTNDDSSGLNDLLLFEGDQDLIGKFTFKNLVAENIYVNKINNINVNDIATNGAIVTGKKYIQSISTDKINTNTLNKETTESVLHYLQNNVHYTFHNIRNLNIKNFNFDIINGIHWRDFSYNLFNTTKHSEIHGDITIHSNVRINNLVTKKLSGINVNEIMTTSTDQTISTNMQLMNVHAQNIITSDLNGLSLKTQAASFFDNNYAKGPITIKQIHITGDVNGKEFPVHQFQDTNRLHMYDGYVKITGSLTLTNVSLNRFTKLFHKNKELPQDYVNEYWLKDKKQVIPTEITALKGLSVTKLNTTYINDKSFVLFSDNYEKDENFAYKFKNIRVKGDVLLNSRKQLKNIEKLLKQAVRKTGKYTITGQKIFQNRVEIKNLNTAIVDNTEVDNLAKANQFNNYTGTKSFKKLIVEDNLILPKNYKLKIKAINNFPIIDLLNRTVYIDRESYVNNLIFKTDIETENVIFENLNNVNVEEMQQKLVDLYVNNVLDKVYIHGDMTLKQLQATNIKNINIDNYFSELVSIHDNIFIKGDITFKKNLFVNNLNADKINGINLKDSDQFYLSRSKEQIISGNYETKTAKFSHISVPEINNIKTNLLIDRTSVEDIHIHSNLDFANLDCDFVNSKSSNFDAQEAVHNLKHLPGLYWKDITVLKDINFQKAGGNFGRLISHAVNVYKNNTIEQEVNFENMFANKIELLKSEISGVNIKEISEDALKNNAQHQVVSGKKIFTKLAAGEMKTLGSTNIKFINGVDILRLNNTIIDKNNMDNNTILGHKQFTANVDINKLKVSSKVHGVLPENLVQINKSYDSPPNAIFKDVEIIENCNFDFIKFVNITHVILKTMKCSSNTPQYVEADMVFKNLVLAGNITTNYINHLDVRNIVVDHGTQYIQNSKKFYSDLNIVGDFNVELLNGYRLSSIYDNSILMGEDVVLDNDVVFKNPIRVNANIECTKINGEDVKKLKRIIENDVPSTTNDTVAAYNELRKIVDYYSNYVAAYP